MGKGKECMNATRLARCELGAIETELSKDSPKRMARMHASRRKRLNPKVTFDFPSLACYITDVTEKSGAPKGMYLLVGALALGAPLY